MALRARLRRRSRGSGVHRRAVRRRRGNPVGACRAPPGWRPSGTRRSATGAWSARGPGRVVAVESLPDQPPHELAQRHARVDVGEQPLELLQSTLALCVDDRLDLPAPLAQRPHPIGRHRQCGVHVGQHLRHLPGAHAGRLLHQRLLRRQVQHRSRLGFRLPFSRPCRRRPRRAVRQRSTALGPATPGTPPGCTPAYGRLDLGTSGSVSPRECRAAQPPASRAAKKRRSSGFRPAVNDSSQLSR